MDENKNIDQANGSLRKSYVSSGRIIGKNVGKYKIVGFLGQGAMATVYKAVDETGAEVALKLLVEGPAIDRKAIERFKREAQGSKALRKHPNIVTVYDTGEEADIHYIAMECISNGRSLNNVLGERKFTIEEALEVSIQIASALDYAHRRGIVHRDIKPGNIMMNEFGQAILTDFGLLKSVDAVVATYTATGQVLGTPIYMSPEQTRGEKVSVQNDIYSLGIVLYEMIAGRAPHRVEQGETIAELFHKIRDVSVPSPRKFNRHIPKRLEAIVLKATERLPGNRYREMSDFLKDLENFRSGRVVMARKPSVFEYFERNVKRYSLRVCIGSTVIGIVLGVVFFLTGKLKQERLELLLNKVRGMSLRKAPEDSPPYLLEPGGSVIPELVVLKPGDDFFDRGEYEKALGVYKDIREHYSKAETANVAGYKVGLCYYQLGKIHEAIEAFSEVRENVEGSAFASLITIELAECFLEDERPEEAEREAGTLKDVPLAFEGSRKLAHFYQRLGDSYRSGEEYSKGEKAYKNSIEIGESIALARFSADCRLKLARLLQEAGRRNEADAEFRQLIELYPGQDWFVGWALIDLGHLYSLDGKLMEGREQYRKLLSGYPDQLWQTEIARLMLGETGPVEFRSKINSFHDEFKNEAYYALGLRYQLEEKQGAAQKYYAACLEVSKDDDWPARLLTPD